MIKQINFDEIEFLKQQLKCNSNSLETIDLSDEQLAFYFCGLFKIENIYDAFVVFSAATLCNSYVKQRHADKEVKHKYTFKKFVKEHVDNLSENPIEGIKIYPNQNFSVVDICGLKFSYHNLGVLNHSCSEKDANKVWAQENLRLTPYAKKLFDISLSFVNEKKISERNQKVFTKIKEEILDKDKARVKVVIEEIMQI